MYGVIQKCSVEGCEKSVKTKGYCFAHYSRVRLYGDPQAEKPLKKPNSGQPPACTVEGCDRQTKARGYCDAHYARYRRFGTPQAEKPIHRHNRPGGKGWTPKTMMDIVKQEEKKEANGSSS